MSVDIRRRISPIAYRNFSLFALHSLTILETVALHASTALFRSIVTSSPDFSRGWGKEAFVGSGSVDFALKKSKRGITLGIMAYDAVSVCGAHAYVATSQI
jgi:hypothetical protein